MIKKLLVSTLTGIMITGISTTAFASSKVSTNNYDSNNISTKSSQSRSYNIPGGKGRLTSNAWRTTGNGSISGNTRQWEYQVSAVYSGNNQVERIRTTWYGSASLKNSASISLGISGSGVSVGSSSSWQNAITVSKYWENNNGAKSSSYRSNMIVSPSRDYRSGTISITNTALVKLRGDAKVYQISSGA